MNGYVEILQPSNQVSNCDDDVLKICLDDKSRNHKKVWIANLRDLIRILGIGSLNPSVVRVCDPNKFWAQNLIDRECNKMRV